MSEQPEVFLPLSQATYYILLALRECRHGYAVMQDVEKISEGSVALGPGTLYGALGKLQKQGIIQQVKVIDADRRKYYVLTDLGREVLDLEYKRILSVVSHTKRVMGEEKR
ncbi:PadR family transcriptional regulator [Domibacillus robiginosus]|uniref:PadR family transcriptional regulator n=1 Tax=Domibacillus robiginosus TaxID=1071054 RepID=UPI00067B455B|nr:PadR family transcriptional regulator [Domibacillus robiginosus]